MTWCEDNGVDYVFGLPGAKPLARKVAETADAVRTARAVGDKTQVRGFAETRHRAGSWHQERRAVARIEATRLGLDIRFVVTNLDHRSAEWLYETLYCARGQAENLIKLHKAQLASGRTSCRSALAKPGPPRSAHRCLLAHARRPRRHSEKNATERLRSAQSSRLRVRERVFSLWIARALAPNRLGSQHSGERPDRAGDVDERRRDAHHYARQRLIV